MQVNPGIIKTLPAAAEVNLSRAPLAAVLSQIRFGSILEIQEPQGIVSFQKAIRPQYPLLSSAKVKTKTFDIDADSVSTNEHPVWRFADAAGTWIVTLTPEFVALETKKYSDRAEFKKRLEFIIEAAESCFAPQVVTRIGVRYFNQLSGDALIELPKLIQPPLLGVLSSNMAGAVDASVSEALFNFEGKNIFARWGQVPAGATVDPSLVKASSERTWILDLDGAGSEQKKWNTKSIMVEISQLTDLIHRFFRWSVTDEFLTHFGAND